MRQAMVSLTSGKHGPRCWGVLAWVLGMGGLVSSVSAIAPAQAEGSRSLFPNNVGFRASLEWRTDAYNQLRRRTLLRVFARQNEVILLGSSAIGVDNGDILVFEPNVVPTAPVGQEPISAAAATFSCSTQRAATLNPTQGVIQSRTQELAGPDTIALPATATRGNARPTGYVPCFYTAPAQGIYTIVIHGPAGFNSPSDTRPAGFVDPIETSTSQNTTVSAWDVTVRSSLTDNTDLNGRLFTYYLAANTGANGRQINSTLFALTTDGFLYQTGLNGLDPFGFAVYGNRVGFFDSDGTTPLNRDVVASDDQLNTIQGGVTIALPEFPLFVNRPDPAAITELGIPLTPIEPVIQDGSFRFNGSLSANNSLVATGGNFIYQANVSHVYEITISRDGQNFDPTNPQNRALRGVRSGGAITVPWNGLDNLGTAFPPGNNYSVRITIRAGEYHFPLLDVENSSLGSPIYELINPPGPGCLKGAAGRCTIAFYDDRGYRTNSGNQVGTLNQPLPNAPTPANSNFGTGFDTTPPSNRAFAGFGDKKGLDLWVYYPSATFLTTLNILTSATADLRVSKTVDTPAAGLGQPATFTIALTNDGPANATNVAVTDRLPAGLGFVSATPSQGTYDPTTGIWTVGTIAANTTQTLRLTATVTTSDPIANTAEVTASDQPDPNSTPNNNIPGENDQATATLGVPNLRLVKRVTAATRAGVPTAYADFVDDPANANDTAPGWSQLPPVGLILIPSSEPLSSGDEIEYTVYFLSDGSRPAIGISLCDQIPARTQLIPETVRVRRGSGAAIVDGAVFSPLAPLPANSACQNPANPTGALLFTLGDLTSTPGSNFGFVRFRVRVE